MVPPHYLRLLAPAKSNRRAASLSLVFRGKFTSRGRVLSTPTLFLGSKSREEDTLADEDRLDVPPVDHTALGALVPESGAAAGRIIDIDGRISFWGRCPLGLGRVLIDAPESDTLAGAIIDSFLKLRT